MRKKTLGLLFLGLSACTTASLHELRESQPKGNAFQTALAKHYLAFSETEAKDYDWMDSKYFAEKGLKAIYGQDTIPEDPAQWHIKAQYLPELQKARKTLLDALDKPHQKTQPDIAAKAQYSYDCWIEQREEDWQIDDIAACRDGFYNAVHLLEGKPAEKPKEPEKSQILSSAYIVFFLFDSAILTPAAEKIVASVAQDLKHAPSQDYEVTLHGHADRAGTAAYNQALSQKRAEAVKATLVAEGVEAAKITSLAFGETKPREKTVDGIKNAANRRVEIFFGQ